MTDEDRRVKLVEFAVVAFKRLQRKARLSFIPMRKSPPALWMR